MTGKKILTALFIGFRILVPAIFLTYSIWQFNNHEYISAATLLFCFFLLGYRNYRIGNNSVSSIIFINCFILLLAGWQGYREYSRYQIDMNAAKFGLPLNKMRHNSGAPVIPAGWYQSPYPSSMIFWFAKKDSFGHVKKVIFLDSLGRHVEWEEDRYKLGTRSKDTNYIAIRDYYNSQKKLDSIRFSFEDSLGVKSISRHQADSIFKAEGIQKDY